MTIELTRDDTRPYAEYVQPKNSKVKYAFDWTDRIARFWAAGTAYSVGTTVRPRASTGYQYVSSGGVSGSLDPFTSSPGQTVTDGSIIWTRQVIDTTSLLTTVQSSAWAGDAGLALTGQTIAGQICTVICDTTGAGEGVDLYLRNTATMVDTSVEVGILFIRVRSVAT